MSVVVSCLTSILFYQALAGLERMQELVGKNLNNIVGNLWNQRQENEPGSGSSHGNIVSTFMNTDQYQCSIKSYFINHDHYESSKNLIWKLFYEWQKVFVLSWEGHGTAFLMQRETRLIQIVV